MDVIDNYIIFFLKPDKDNNYCLKWFSRLRDNFTNDEYKHYHETLKFIQDNNLNIDSLNLILITDSFLHDQTGKTFRDLFLLANEQDQIKSNLIETNSIDDNIYALQKCLGYFHKL
jgi:hypothetical protein